MKKEQMLALFQLANIEVLNCWQIENKYWPDVAAYAKIRAENPWWLIKTNKGLIEIGHRKNVTSIDWTDTNIKVIVTEDDVTKDHSFVHAWTLPKVVEYLMVLGKHINEIELG